MKKAFLYLILCVMIVVTLILSIIFIINQKMNFTKFNYNDSKKDAITILNKNKKQLTKIGNELYETKSNKSNPIDEISYANFLSAESNSIKKEYVQFGIDAQGMLGGQYYGLIYATSDINSGKNVNIVDESQYGNGNNIFIYEFIEKNWYFYYFDYDGKINVNEIK